MESFDDKLNRVLAERVDIVEHDPSWEKRYEAEVERLTAFFPPGAILRIEHIGSTAVPGLPAKPIVDILVGVEDLGFVEAEVAPRMEAAGYDFFMRPVLGDDGPRYPWFIGRDAEGRRLSHIHVALVGDVSQWDRLAFRDLLRAHPEAASEYAALKRDLAQRFGDDREAYTRGKSAFVRRAMAAVHRGDEAGRLFSERASCSQAVFAAFAPSAGLDGRLAMNLAAGFGGGMHAGATCGAATGAVLALGVLFGGEDSGVDRKRVMDAVESFLERFRQQVGALDCPDIIGCDVRTEEGRAFSREHGLRETRCHAAVRTAAEIVELMRSEAGRSADV